MEFEVSSHWVALEKNRGDTEAIGWCLMLLDQLRMQDGTVYIFEEWARIMNILISALETRNLRR